MKSNVDEDYLIEERKRIGLELRHLRESKGLTSQQLADEMSISRSTISKIEAGKWNFGIDTITSIGVYLKFRVKIQESI